MTRSFFAAVALGVAGIALAPAVLEGCQSTGIGDPCTPDQEYDTDFDGLSVQQVAVESSSVQCQSRLCLANHFQGLVSCPYGQAAGDDKCQTLGVKQPVQGAVAPQCLDRTADKAVYCSCRCANLDGQTDDGANYCTCPSGFACTQLVTSNGFGDKNLTGAFCIKDGTAYDSTSSCQTTCDAAKANCGPT